MGQITVVVGAQWGDEGKGKWVDTLARDAHIVARFQGGNNAGHTLMVNGKSLVLHQLPSGVLNPEKISCLLAGVVIDPIALVEEIRRVGDFCSLSPDNVWISSQAHIISPFHVYLDHCQEAGRDQPIGTTKRGIGPAYSTKYSRSGLRVGEFVDAERRRQWIEQQERTYPEFSTCVREQAEQWLRFAEAAEFLQAFVTTPEQRIRERLHGGGCLLLEGAQGTLLDIEHGTYPYVTSSSTTAAYAAVSLGIDPRKINHIYGIAKAYTTRVGGGPFPSELHDELGVTLMEKGHEYGATTQRPRRCGWFDAVAMRYAAAINGLDALYLNKVDILSGFSDLKIVTAYKYPDGSCGQVFPTDHHVLSKCQPIYQEFPGWDTPIQGAQHKRDLPEEAVTYLKAIAHYSGVPLAFIGTGPGRADYINWQ